MRYPFSCLALIGNKRILLGLLVRNPIYIFHQINVIIVANAVLTSLGTTISSKNVHTPALPDILFWISQRFYIVKTS